MRRILINGSFAAVVAFTGLAAESGVLGSSPLVVFARQANVELDDQVQTKLERGERNGGDLDRHADARERREREHPCRKTFSAAAAGPSHCDP